jgi:hypothetical protein
LVRIIAPHTEADEHAVLFQFLVAFGNLIGRTAHFTVEGARHGTNLDLVVVGETAKARKGSSWSQVRRLLEMVDPEWAASRIQSGLSSGEGLVWAVRDPIRRPRGTRSRASRSGETEYVADPGVSDKRLLVHESEFAAPLSMMRREGNTLSPLLRLAWETGDLQALTKNSPAKATGSHISVVGHITQDELVRHLRETEVANGLGNRFLWVSARRSKLLPEGGSLENDVLVGLAERLRLATAFAFGAGEIKRDEGARAFWREIYPELSRGHRGMFGALTSRAEAQTMRLAMIYALLDQSRFIERVHLEAALALWSYCERSCMYIFGDALGDALADQALYALRAHRTGLTRTELRDLFGRHQHAEGIGRALAVLQDSGLATRIVEHTNGRPAERWMAATDATNAT